jgi:hypothetical protein
MQDNLQIADVVETTTSTVVAEPIELTVEQLQQVGGGVTTAAGPHDNW